MQTTCKTEFRKQTVTTYFGMVLSTSAQLCRQELLFDTKHDSEYKERRKTRSTKLFLPHKPYHFSLLCFCTFRFRLK